MGIDISPVALASADAGLPTASPDAIVSIDALIFAPDKSAAIAELARVLRPGGRLAITTWDYHRQPARRSPPSPVWTWQPFAPATRRCDARSTT